MTILSYAQLVDLVEDGVIENANPENINSASIDITLGRYIMKEDRRVPDFGDPYEPQQVRLKNRDSLLMSKVDLVNSQDREYKLRPGEFILAQSQEVFNLPADLSAEYKLKSSMARIGLEHLNAGWCDAGWHGSVLTLELRNMTTFHDIILTFGDKIGQMVFFRHSPVPIDKSYAHRGAYNKNAEVSGARKETDITKAIRQHQQDVVRGMEISAGLSPKGVKQ